MDVRVHDGVASVAVGDALLTVWRRPARAARIEHVTAVATELIARSPGGIVAGQFLLPSAGPPGLAERRVIQAGIDAVFPHARRLVTTPLGDAAWHAVVRGVMRVGVTLLGQARVVKVAATPAEAFQLLGGAASPATPDVAALAAAYEALHAALGAA